MVTIGMNILYDQLMLNDLKFRGFTYLTFVSYKTTTKVFVHD